MADMFDLSGRCAVVTGAAGIIGSAVSKGLAAKGATVAMVDIRADALEARAEEVRALGEVVAVAGDVSGEEGVRETVSRILAAVGSVHILFNNVGTGIHTVP